MNEKKKEGEAKGSFWLGEKRRGTVSQTCAFIKQRKDESRERERERKREREKGEKRKEDKRKKKKKERRKDWHTKHRTQMKRS